jgi:nucleoside-diphosphate-sugar epimerase
MKYVFAGSTSGTGHAVLSRLVSKIGTDNLICIVRTDSNIDPHKLLDVNYFQADITEPKSFEQLLDSNTVYIDMTHPKYYHRSLEAVMSRGVERAYFVTTTGIFSSYNHLSDIYKINEEKIRQSGLVYTILRPSMIYGHPRDRNMSRLIRFLKQYPIYPLFNDGRSLMQPVFFEDLADGIVNAINERKTEKKEYNLCGLESIQYKKLIETIIYKLGVRTKTINVPSSLAIIAAQVGSLIPGFPITVEQVLRLQEDKIFDISKAISDLNYSPRKFEDGIEIEIRVLKELNLL